ncbi:MAG: oxygen-independent coproporphyrinogen-3 oxidase [Roseivirga sp.]
MAGIYLHIPFCKQACHYCDFHFSTSLKRKSEMIQAIADELMLRKNEISETVETIYFGGGTPSLLTIVEIQFLIHTIQQNFEVTELPEITLEANPDDLTEEKILELADSPINRLSIGIQSFFEDDLKFMNRSHSASESKDCLSVANRHFENITIDLIYGVPNMSIDKWTENLQIALDFGVNHISSYALTVEPKTALDLFIKSGKFPPLDEQLASDHFDILVEETKKNGLVHYEISNFGKPNYYSKHNTSYWQGKQYLGVGPSAHSFKGKERSWNVSNNAKYIKSIQDKILPREVEILSINDQFNEYVMTGLRTIWGVSLDKVEQEYGETYKIHLINGVEGYERMGLLEINNNIVIATKKGKFLVDGIASELFMVD